MTDKRKIKVLICCLFLAALVLTTAAAFFGQTQQCMGVPLIAPKGLADLTEVSHLDLGQLQFNGRSAATDLSTGTVYISQSPDKLYHHSALEGVLSSTDPNCELYFLTDSVADPAASVQSGTPLTLILKSHDCYQRVKVVLTTLPVLSMNGQPTDLYDEGRQIFSGSITLWSGKDPGTGSYTVQSSQSQWHIRGATSATLPKTPWKLSLKDSENNNADLDLLGLGSDDDWILNPMNLDDSKIREKLCADFWNEYIYSGHDGYPMTDSEYVEVVLDGRYWGLYLLQRRIDAKYLRLDEDEDLLFKGIKTWTPNSLSEAYEIVSSPFDPAVSYSLLGGSVDYAADNIDLQSYLDTTLFVQYFCLPDNTGYYNMFYVLRAAEDGYRAFFVPWDTDMSMGIQWEEGYGFRYNYEATLALGLNRIEVHAMRAKYPNLHTLLSERWQALRQTAYTEETVYGLLGSSISLLQTSGALDREVARWRLYYGGQDTHEALYQWCRERLQRLDTLYGN